MGSDDVGTFEKITGPRVQSIMLGSATPELVPGVDDDSHLGLATKRTDGSWRVSDVGGHAWGDLALRPQAGIAKSAPREELDRAREPMRRIFRESGFDPSDLVVACSVPKAVYWFLGSERGAVVEDLRP